jgi:ADP-ribose pyrophosphatase YjhB (NUDIX family)
MIMFVYEKVKGKNINYWTLDIPGGKRYLGETALKCAIHETEEETSVILSEKWCTTNHCTDVNCYFIFDPNVA